MPRQSKRFWLALDPEQAEDLWGEEPYVQVYFCRRKPKLVTSHTGNHDYYPEGAYHFCSKDFIQLTGLRLKPGEVRRARLVLED